MGEQLAQPGNPYPAAHAFHFGLESHDMDLDGGGRPQETEIGNQSRDAQAVGAK